MVRPAARTAALVAVVGASYTFDPAADGMAGIYAVRVLDRGGDPRALYAEIRADRGSSTERSDLRRALHLTRSHRQFWSRISVAPARTVSRA